MSAYLTVEMWAAKEFGFNAAAVLAQAILWDACATRNGWNPHDGYYWLKHTRRQWHADLEESISVPSIIRALADLTAAGLIVTRHDRDNATFLRIDHDVYEDRRRGARPRPRRYTPAEERPDPSDQNDPRVGGARIKKIRPSDHFDPRCQPLEEEKEESKEGSVPAAPSACGTVGVGLPDDPTRYTRNPDRPDAPEATPPTGHTNPPAKTRPRAPKPPCEPTPGARIWEAYRDAYRQAYRDRDGNPIEPLRNAKANTACARLAKSMPVDEAVALARFYLTCRTQFYVGTSHDVVFLESNAASLRTQMLSGRRMTATLARQVDKDGALGDVAERAIERWNAKCAAEEQRGGSK